MDAASSSRRITRSEVVRVGHLVVEGDGWSTVFIFVVFVEVVVCLKMAKGNPVLFSLIPWVKGEVLFNSVLVVSFESHPKRSLLPVMSERMSEEFLGCVVGLNVLLIALCSQCLGYLSS
jgi:hypothetical protein